MFLLGLMDIYITSLGHERLIVRPQHFKFSPLHTSAMPLIHAMHKGR
jgi:hypothetical protein